MLITKNFVSKFKSLKDDITFSKSKTQKPTLKHPQNPKKTVFRIYVIMFNKKVRLTR